MLVALLFQLGIEQRAAEFGRAAGRRHARAPRGAAAGRRRIAGGGVGLRCGRGGRHRLRLADAGWPAHLVAGRHFHPVSQCMSRRPAWRSAIWSACSSRPRPFIGPPGACAASAVRRLLAGEAQSTPLLAPGEYRRTRRAGWATVRRRDRAGDGCHAAGGRSAGRRVFHLGPAGALWRCWYCCLCGCAGWSAPGGETALARTVGDLALRSGARNPRRSTLSVGLVAAASFLIVATSAFRLDPEAEAHVRASGSGGFALVAESDQPIYQNLNTEDGRDELGFSAKSDKLLAATDAFALASARRRRRQLLESLSSRAAARAGRADRPDRTRRICLGRYGRQHARGASQSLAAARARIAGRCGRCAAGAGRARFEHRHVQPALDERGRRAVCDHRRAGRPRCGCKSWVC